MEASSVCAILPQQSTGFPYPIQNPVQNPFNKLAIHRCFYCKEGVHSSVAITLDCGHVYDRECIVESIVRTPAGNLACCWACFLEDNKTPLSYYDVNCLVGEPQLVRMLKQVKLTESNTKLPAKTVYCTNPACSSSQLMTPVFYDSHQMFVCP